MKKEIQITTLFKKKKSKKENKIKKKKNMENSFHVMSHEELVDVEGGLLIGLVVVGGVAIAGTFLLGAVDGASGAHAKRRGR